MPINQQADLLLAQAEEAAQSALRHLPQADPTAAEPHLTKDRKALTAQP